MNPNFLLPLFLCIGISTSTLIAQETPLYYGPDNYIKIEEGSGGFTGSLDGGDRFSRDHDVAGDINDDGVLDLIVGARSDDDGSTDAGAVYILFMNANGTVASPSKNINVRR